MSSRGKAIVDEEYSGRIVMRIRLGELWKINWGWWWGHLYLSCRGSVAFEAFF